jgi:hypothetical protein
MTPIRSASLTALLLLSAACGGGEAGRSAAPDSAAAALPSAEQEAMPAPSDPFAGQDTSWTLRHDGIGPLRVGMTVDQARTALGDFHLVQFDPGAPADSMACGAATSTRLPAGVRVMTEGARVVRVEVDSGSIATAEGARIGDTEARIQQLYPGHVTVGPHKYTDGHYLTIRPAEASDTTHLLVFETDGRVVLHFRGGQKPQVEYVEGCA